MSVIDEDGFDWESMSDESEEAPDQEEDGQPSQTEAEQDEATAPEGTGRLRDEHGRFAKQEQEEEEPDVEADDDALARAAERHGTDDPEKLLKIIADQTEHTRNLQSQLDKLVHQQQQQLEFAQQQAAPQYDYDEIAEDDPSAATMLAWQNQDQQAFPKAWQAWAEEDPGRAAAWLAQAEIGVLRQELEEKTAPLYAQNQAQAQQAAVAHFGKAHPDVTDHAETMARIIEERPYWKIPLEQGPIEAKIQVLTDAYNASKALAAGTLTDASQQVGKAQAQATQEALNDAFVASASNAVREAPEPSIEDVLAEGWEKTGLYWGK